MTRLAEITEEKQQSFPYRNPPSRHNKIKATAAELGISMQELIDAAVDAYLKSQRKEGPKPKGLVDLQNALTAAWEHRNEFPYDYPFSVAKNALDRIVKQLSEK